VEDMQQKIRGFMRIAYPQGNILAVHVVPDLRRVMAVAKDLRVSKKRHYRYQYFEAIGEPRFKRDYYCCGEAKDALALTVLEARINKERLEAAWARVSIS